MDEKPRKHTDDVFRSKFKSDNRKSELRVQHNTFREYIDSDKISVSNPKEGQVCAGSEKLVVDQF